jgi:hypothetical protein
MMVGEQTFKKDFVINLPPVARKPRISPFDNKSTLALPNGGFAFID